MVFFSFKRGKKIAPGRLCLAPVARMYDGSLAGLTRALRLPVRSSRSPLSPLRPSLLWASLAGNPASCGRFGLVLTSINSVTYCGLSGEVLFALQDLSSTIPPVAALQIPNSPFGLTQWDLRSLRCHGNSARKNLRVGLKGPPRGQPIVTVFSEQSTKAKWA